MTLQEAYSVLGIKAGDTQITIKRKYHALLHRYHPDTGSGTCSSGASWLKRGGSHRNARRK
ncbi:MAG: DnaJ domain-containing protein [Lachnospiraceae bacterium]|nr:DnaJ domain-containing protein [Lachnospiraceae bacterium]